MTQKKRQLKGWDTVKLAEARRPKPKTPEEIRARLQLEAVDAIEILRRISQNTDDPKSSIAASEYLIEIAGYGPPAKAKIGDLLSGGGVGGEAIPSVEDDVRKMGAAFAQMPATEE